jgi:hypothetical protein
MSGRTGPVPDAAGTTAPSRPDPGPSAPPAPPATLAEALAGAGPVGDTRAPVPPGVLVSAAEHPGLLPGEARIECPGCGAAWLRRTGSENARRPVSASSFCPSCDYPLFLAPGGREPAPPPVSDEAQRRRPGVGGRDELGAVACPACGEPNPPDRRVGARCIRCDGALNPPPPAPEPVVVRETVEVHVVHVDRRWMWVALGLAIALVLAVSVVVWALVARGG